MDGCCIDNDINRILNVGSTLSVVEVAPLLSRRVVSGLFLESEPEMVKPSSRRTSASPLMLIPPIPIKWMAIGL